MTAKNKVLSNRTVRRAAVLQNCLDPASELARTAGERTRSQVVQVIGRKIVLYKEGKDDKKKINLPPAVKK